MLETYLVHDLLSYYGKICVHNINETYVCSGCRKYLSIFTYQKRLIFDNTIINKYTFLIVLLYKFSKTTTLFISFSISMHMLDMFCIKKKNKRINYYNMNQRKNSEIIKKQIRQKISVCIEKKGKHSIYRGASSHPR